MIKKESIINLYVSFSNIYSSLQSQISNLKIEIDKLNEELINDNNPSTYNDKNNSAKSETFKSLFKEKLFEKINKKKNIEKNKEKEQKLDVKGNLDNIRRKSIFTIPKEEKINIKENNKYIKRYSQIPLLVNKKVHGFSMYSSEVDIEAREIFDISSSESQIEKDEKDEKLENSEKLENNQNENIDKILDQSNDESIIKNKESKLNEIEANQYNAIKIELNNDNSDGSFQNNIRNKIKYRSIILSNNIKQSKSKTKKDYSMDYSNKFSKNYIKKRKEKKARISIKKENESLSLNSNANANSINLLNSNNKLQELLKQRITSVLIKSKEDDQKPVQDERINDVNIHKHKSSYHGIDKLDIPESQLNDLKLEIAQYPVSSILIDPQLTILFCNNLLITKLFQNKAELIDTNLTSHVDIDNRNDFEEFISNSFSTETSIEKDNMFKIYDKNSNKIPFIINQRKIVFENDNPEKDSIKLLILTLSINNNYSENIQSDCLIIDPRGQFQLVWSLFILFIITSMIYQLPQSLVFGALAQDIYWQDIPLTIIFTFDIMINMSLAFKIDNNKSQNGLVEDKKDNEEKEDKEDEFQDHQNNYNFNRYDIICQQLRTWMLFDIFATFPSDLIFQQFFINTQFFRTVKIIKLIKFLKILRLTKLQQLYQYIVRQKDLYSFFKKNQGYLDLLKNMFMIQIASHYQTIIYWQYQSSQIDDENSKIWSRIDYDTLKSEYNISIYNFILFESIKTALGLGVINIQNDTEAWFNIIWMCIGLSMQGYGIGNISSQLNYTNKEDLQYSTSINQFTELCSFNNIDPRVHRMVMDELENYQSKFQDIELIFQGKYLTSRTLSQLESEINKTFVHKFNLFQQLNSQSIRTFKLSCKFEHKKIVLRKDMNMNEIYCIIHGKISIQDSKMQFLNAYHSQEIFGISYFQKQLNLRYKIDILNVLNRLKNKDIITQAIKKKIGQKSEKVGHGSVIQNKKFDMSSEIIELKEKFKNNQNHIQMRFNYNALASDDVLFLVIPYQSLEEILLEDMESFQEIQNQHLKQSELISEDDYKEYQTFQEEFMEEDIPALIVLDTGQIQSKNLVFDEAYNDIKMKIIGMNIFDIINDKDKKISNIFELKNGNQVLNVGDEYQNIKILMGGFKKIIQGEIKYDLDDQNQEYYRYKKSMLNGQYIYFIIEDFNKSSYDIINNEQIKN